MHTHFSQERSPKKNIHLLAIAAMDFISIYIYSEIRIHQMGSLERNHSESKALIFKINILEVLMWKKIAHSNNDIMSSTTREYYRICIR